MSLRALFGCLCAYPLAAQLCSAQEHTVYQLKPELIAADTYIFRGRDEDFTRENGGNIVNTAFIITAQGVVVIDTGPSRLYGEEMLAAIRALTDKPVLVVFNTHHHPDHCLGNQAFQGARLLALPETIASMSRAGNQFEENMYRLLGNWMRDTDFVLPAEAALGSVQDFGNHRLRIIAAGGHTDGDLAIFDETTGVLFAGDLVFNQRVPTVPDAEITQWRNSLQKLAALPFKLLVPGHGNVAGDAAPLTQTEAYLTWLERTLRDAAAQGLDLTEVLHQPPPEQVRALKVFAQEFPRSAAQLFPQYEREVLQ